MSAYYTIRKYRQAKQKASISQLFYIIFRAIDKLRLDYRVTSGLPFDLYCTVDQFRFMVVIKAVFKVWPATEQIREKNQIGLYK